MVRIFSFGERWNVLFNRTEHSIFHLMKIFLTIALINIHYLYTVFLYVGQ